MNFFPGRSIILLLSAFLAASCDRPEDNSEGTPLIHEASRSSTVTDADPPDRYSPHFVSQHDLAVSLWFAKQYSAMSSISFDDQGEVRLKSYRTFSKTDDKADAVLDYQVLAINELVTSQQLSNRADLLDEWCDIQRDAAKILQEFLKDIKMEPAIAPFVAEDSNAHEVVIRRQRVYLQAFEKYREEWKDRAGKGPGKTN